MPSAAAIKAGAAFVELSLRRAQFESGLIQAERSLTKFSQSFLKVGTVLTGLGASLAIPLAYASNRFIDFDDRLRFIKATTQSTVREMEQLEQVLRKLGRTTSFSLSNVSEGAAQLALSGFNNQEIQQSISSILDLSRATRTELPQAADIAAKVLRGFGLEASEMSRVVDVLTSTATGSAQTLEDLFESIKLVTSYGRTGEAQNLEQIAASLGELANAGLTGSLAGTSLRRIFTNLATKRDEIKALTNVETLDGEGNLRNFISVLEEMTIALDSLGTGDQLKILNDVFEVRGLQSAKLIGQGLPGLKAFINRLKESEGTAEQVAKEIDGGLGGAFRRFLSVLDEIINQVGKALEAFSPWLDGINQIIGATSSWVSRNTELVQIATLALASTTALGAAFIATGIAIGSSALLVGSYAKTVKALSSVFKIFTGGLKAVTALVVGPFTVAFKLLSEATVATFKVFSSGLSFLLDNFLQFGSIVTRVLSKILSELATTAVNLVSRFTNTAIAGIAAATSAVITNLIGAVSSLVGTLVSFLLPAIVFAGAAFLTLQTAVSLATTLAEKFSDVLEGVSSLAISLGDSFVKTGQILGDVFTEFGSVFTETFAGLDESFNSLSISVRKLFREIKSLLSKFFEIGPAADRGLATAKTAMNSFKEVVRNSVRFISDVILTIQENWEVAMIALQIAWRKAFVMMAEYFNDNFTNAVFGGEFELAAQVAFKNIENEMIKMIQRVLDHFEISKDDLRSLINSFSSIAKGVRDTSSGVVASRANLDEFLTRIQIGTTRTIGFLTGTDTEIESAKLWQRTQNVRKFFEESESNTKPENTPVFDLDSAAKELQELTEKAKNAENAVIDKLKKDLEELYRQLEKAKQSAREAASERSKRDSELAARELGKTTKQIVSGSAGTFSAAAAGRLGVASNVGQQQLAELKELKKEAVENRRREIENTKLRKFIKRGIEKQVEAEAAKGLI